jgi:hypothetical protein
MISLRFGLFALAFLLTACKGGPPAAETETPSGDSSRPTYDPCAGKACGDTCSLCAPDDPDCMETAEVKACNADGACVSETGDLCP